MAAIQTKRRFISKTSFNQFLTNSSVSQIEDYSLEKTFKWVPDLSKVREINRGDHGLKFYGVRALHPMTTDPSNVGHGARRWTIEETMKAARTLAHKPLNIMHAIPIIEGKNFVVDAEFSDGEIQSIMAVQDPEIIEGIKNKYITKVSVQGKARENPLVCEAGQCAMEPRGTIYEALALIVTKEGFTYQGKPIPPEPPGDDQSEILLIESNKLNVEEAKKAGLYCEEHNISFCSQKTFQKHLATHQNNTALSQRSTSSQIMQESVRNILAKITQHNENLDAVTAAINGLADVPEDIKAQLLAVAKQAYGSMETKNQPAAPPAPAATAQPGAAQLGTLESKIAGIEKNVTELQDYTKNKMTEILNKTLDEKLANFKPTSAPAPQAGGNATLEKLSDGELGKVLETKLQSVPLSELLAKFDQSKGI